MFDDATTQAQWHHQSELEQMLASDTEYDDWIRAYDAEAQRLYGETKMDVSGFLTSNGALLKKEDIGQAKPHVKIAAVDITEFDGDKKLVLRFEGKEKGMALNKTNTLILSEAFGTESDHWIGREVELWVDPYVTYAGKVVGGLKLTPLNVQAAPPPPPPQAQAQADPNDDIPF